MKRTGNWLLAAAAACGIGGVARAAETPAPAAGAGNAAFSTELFAQLGRDAAGKNIFVSPYSISMALAMTAQGAAGQTKAQMDKVLHITGPDSTRKEMANLSNLSDVAGEDNRGFTLTLANALWSDQSFPMKADFVAVVQNQFHAQADTVDFLRAAEPARARINAWVEKQTNDKIKDLLPEGSVDKATTLVLTNAVYFKAAWQFPFTESATSDQPFHLGEDKDVTVPMMQGAAGTFLKYGETDDAQVVALPYQMTAAQRRGSGPGGGVTEMVLIVPKKADGLAAVEKEMTPENLNKWIGAMESAPVQVLMPRFKMTTSLELAETLKAMGMTDAFSSGADFSGISASANDRLRISAVVHKAFVDVNEQGTEAAAATAVTMMRMALIQEKAIIRADHPFLFLIRDAVSGTVLFMGQVMDPTK